MSPASGVLGLEMVNYQSRFRCHNVLQDHATPMVQGSGLAGRNSIFITYIKCSSGCPAVCERCGECKLIATAGRNNQASAASAPRSVLNRSGAAPPAFAVG